jgi:Domain of unknown function (DUF4399)
MNAASRNPTAIARVLAATVTLCLAATPVLAQTATSRDAPRAGAGQLTTGAASNPAAPDHSGHGMAAAARAAPAPVGGPVSSTEGAKVYIVWPRNGQTITGGFWVRMGLRNMGIAPAGIDKANTGHHHILIDTGLPPLDEPIPNDKNHLHFGGGQTEVRLELPPGQHTLQLLLGDKDHIPHNPPLMSERITIFVR